jgi:hypothetical protein
MTKKYNLYLGKAGQLVVMSNFLVRGWNVATPEVDVGDDIFVVEDKKGIFYRVQVKTANAVPRGTGYSAQFNLSVSQVNRYIDPEIYYVLVVCKERKWTDMLIISRQAVANFHAKHNMGTVHKDSLLLYLSFQANKITCSEVELTSYNYNFDDFPIITH